MKKTARSSSSTIKQISSNLNISIASIYLVILIIVSLTGILVANGALNQSQDTRSSASSYQTVGCNQPCLNNRYCQADHFCYQGQCRLATNPESSTCNPSEVIISLTPTKIPSPTDNPLTGQKGEPAQTPTASSGAEATTSAQNIPTRTPTINESDYEPMPLPQIKPSLINQVANQFKEVDSQLLLIIGVGVGGLIILIILVAVVNGGKKKDQLKPISFDNLETSKNKSNLQTPTPVVKPQQPAAPRQGETKPANQIPKPKQSATPTAQNQDLTPPPSSMVSRIKEKKIQKPKNN